MNKISIIIPVYNVEKYLEKCLESIINQSLKEIEIILINDCSLDGSLEIIKKYAQKDNRIILINKKENEGVSEARNSGIKIARGEYILCIDGDDWIEKECLKEMYEIAKRNEAEVVVSDFYLDYGNGNIIYQIDQKSETEVFLEKNESIKNIFSGNGFPSIWNKLVKREIYEKNNIKFPSNISMGEDLLTVLSLIYSSTKIVKLNKAYLHYIQNPKGATKEYRYKALEDIYYVLKEVDSLFKKEYKEFVEKLKFHQLSIWIFRVKPKYNDKLYKDILKEYLLLLESKKMQDNKKYIKCYFIFRKVLNPYLSFKVIWKLINLRRKIKL